MGPPDSMGFRFLSPMTHTDKSPWLGLQGSELVGGAQPKAAEIPSLKPGQQRPTWGFCKSLTKKGLSSIPPTPCQPVSEPVYSSLNPSLPPGLTSCSASKSPLSQGLLRFPSVPPTQLLHPASVPIILHTWGCPNLPCPSSPLTKFSTLHCPPSENHHHGTSWTSPICSIKLRPSG